MIRREWEVYENSRVQQFSIASDGFSKQYKFDWHWIKDQIINNEPDNE